MPFIELFDETLDINSTENYELSVQASPDGLIFCLLDTIRNKYVLFRAFEPDHGKYLDENKINELIIRDDFLTRIYKKTSLIIPAARFTLVPAPLFEPARKNDYFGFNHGIDNNCVLMSNRISDPDAYTLFSISKQMYDMLSFHFPGASISHYLKPLFTHITHARRGVFGNYTHLHIEREFFCLINYSQSELRLCNSYSYRSTNDILYYTLNAFRKLGLGQEETLHISGNAENHDAIKSGLGSYIRIVKFAVPTGAFTFSYVFNETSLHRHLTLFTITKCE